MTVNLWQQDFAAECSVNGIARRAARVMLTADSTGGQVQYDAAVVFFVHADAEDFCINPDGYFSETLFAGKGRRSKKREAALLQELHAAADRIASAQNGRIFWDQPLGPLRTE